MSRAAAAALIDRFAEEITVERTSPGTFQNGIFVPGETTTLQCRASVQPLNGREQITLSELQREKSTFKLYLDTELFVSNQTQGRAADRVVVRGKRHEVSRVEPWAYELEFFKAIIVGVEA